jgi:protein phosphatase
MAYEIIQASVIGKQNRGSDKENEDTIIVDRKRGIYLVADGMGGHSAAKTASHLACQIVYPELKGLYGFLRKSEFQTENISDFMKEIFIIANGIITSAAQNGTKDVKGMGTTLDACIIHDNVAYWGHTGNGRIYKLNKEGKLVKLTQEHVPYGKDIKKYSPIEQTVIEMGLGLDSYIGCGEDIQIDVGKESVEPGEILFIESDGLTHTVSEDEIVYAFGIFAIARKTLLALSEKPLKMAEAHAKIKEQTTEKSRKELGGKDNTSFIAVRRVS